MKDKEITTITFITTDKVYKKHNNEATVCKQKFVNTDYATILKLLNEKFKVCLITKTKVKTISHQSKPKKIATYYAE